MFDRATAALIQSTPELDRLDRESLPETLTLAFAQIVAARLRLNSSDVERTDSLSEIVDEVARLAVTNEALVSVAPDRENRAAVRRRAPRMTSQRAPRQCRHIGRRRPS